MESTQYTVNKSNCCFLCVKLVHPDSSKYNDCGSDARGGSGENVPPTKSSLHKLLHYLKADLGEHPVESKDISTDSLRILMAPDHRFTLCEACMGLCEHFSRKLRDLDKAQMTLDYSLRSIYDRARKADKGNHIMERARARQLWGGSSCQYDVVEGMRRKLLDKCSRKLRKAEPRVRIKKLSIDDSKISKVKNTSKDAILEQDSFPEVLIEIGDVKVEQSYPDSPSPSLNTDEQDDNVKANDTQSVQEPSQESEPTCTDSYSSGLEITKVIVVGSEPDDDIPVPMDDICPSSGHPNRRKRNTDKTLANPVCINLMSGQSWLIKHRRSFYSGQQNADTLSLNPCHNKRPRPNDTSRVTTTHVNGVNGNHAQQVMLPQLQLQQQSDKSDNHGGNRPNNIPAPPTPPTLPTLEEDAPNPSRTSLTRCGICRMIVSDLTTHLYYAHSRVVDGTLQHVTQAIPAPMPPPPQSYGKPQLDNIIIIDPITRKLNCSCSPSKPFSNGGSFQCHYKTVDFDIRYQCAKCRKDFLQKVTFTLRVSTWVSDSYAMFAIKCFPVTLS